MTETWHNRLDYPATLGLLQTLIGQRGDHDRLGYHPEGAEVDWDLLTSPDAPVSSTQRAALLVAHGCAILERHGGLPPDLRSAVIAAVESAA